MTELTRPFGTLKLTGASQAPGNISWLLAFPNVSTTRLATNKTAGLVEETIYLSLETNNLRPSNDLEPLLCASFSSFEFSLSCQAFTLLFQLRGDVLHHRNAISSLLPLTRP